MTQTKSEMMFERFLSTNGIEFRPIATDEQRTPDYEVVISNNELIFEIKELGADPTFHQEAVHSRTVGKHVRKKIKHASKQMQTASENGKPTVLLIFNNRDPLQLFGTEDHDFEHAMYGELSVRIDKSSGKIVDRFHGHNKSFQPNKNTSFSAVGRLTEDRGSVRVTLFENIHARVPVDYNTLPTCFEVVRVNHERAAMDAQRESDRLHISTPKRTFAIDRRGTVRLTICIGRWALKVARNATGRRCNRFEANLWARTTAVRRSMLCPVLARLPFGFGLIMQRAEPLSESEKNELIESDGFPDWDYLPPDETCPFEYKASDWGRLPNGRIVALDYSAPALD
jgi:hypothetical protein